MYLQIMEEIKRRIAVGDWTEGQAIPSIRQLAADIQVRVITVKRAYLEIEREGVIVTQQGKGSHVASKLGLGAMLREQELQQHLREATRLARGAFSRNRPAIHCVSLVQAFVHSVVVRCTLALGAPELIPSRDRGSDTIERRS